MHYKNQYKPSHSRLNDLEAVQKGYPFKEQYAIREAEVDKNTGDIHRTDYSISYWQVLDYMRKKCAITFRQNSIVGIDCRLVWTNASKLVLKGLWIFEKCFIARFTVYNVIELFNASSKSTAKRSSPQIG